MLITWSSQYHQQSSNVVRKHHRGHELVVSSGTIGRSIISRLRTVACFLSVLTPWYNTGIARAQSQSVSVIAPVSGLHSITCHGTQSPAGLNLLNSALAALSPGATTIPSLTVQVEQHWVAGGQNQEQTWQIGPSGYSWQDTAGNGFSWSGGSGTRSLKGTSQSTQVAVGALIVPFMPLQALEYARATSSVCIDEPHINPDGSARLVITVPDTTLRAETRQAWAFDPRTFLPIRLVYEDFNKRLADRISIRMMFSGYEQFAGVLIPRQISYDALGDSVPGDFSDEEHSDAVSRPWGKHNERATQMNILDIQQSTDSTEGSSNE